MICKGCNGLRAERGGQDIPRFSIRSEAALMYLACHQLFGFLYELSASMGGPRETDSLLFPFSSACSSLLCQGNSTTNSFHAVWPSKTPHLHVIQTGTQSSTSQLDQQPTFKSHLGLSYSILQIEFSNSRCSVLLLPTRQTMWFNFKALKNTTLWPCALWFFLTHSQPSLSSGQSPTPLPRNAFWAKLGGRESTHAPQTQRSPPQLKSATHPKRKK